VSLRVHPRSELIPAALQDASRRTPPVEHAPAFGVRQSDWRFSPQRRTEPNQTTSHAGSSARSESGRPNCRTYSPSKVIHRWRGVNLIHTPEPTVNNFGGAKKMLCQQLSIWLNRKVGHAGPGRRIPHSNVVTFIWRCSLRALRLVVKEYSEPFARKSKILRRRTSISASIRQGLRAWHQQKRTP
jgi:hypothetical protein